MAFHDSLSDAKQSVIHQQLTALASTEHDKAYQSNISKANSKLAKKRCAGRYEGSWYRLRNDWVAGKVTNLHVYDCIRFGRVIGDTLGVEFTSCHR